MIGNCITLHNFTEKDYLVTYQDRIVKGYVYKYERSWIIRWATSIWNHIVSGVSWFWNKIIFWK